MITLGVYLVGSGLTAATPAGGHWFIFLYATRVIAGMGIGGEYAAINSAIDEMIPAKYRGRVDLAVNGTYWAGAFIGTIVTLCALNHVARRVGLAGRLPGRPGARAGDHLRPAQPAGEPALADHARQGGGSRGVDRGDRARRRGDQGRACRRWTRARNRDPADRPDRLPGPAAGAVPALPEPLDPRRRADDHAVVPVQRDLLHLRARAGVLLQRQRPTDTAYYFMAFAVGQPARAADPRAAVRHGRPPEDDLRHLHPVRHPADHHRPTVPGGVAERRPRRRSAGR